ncbi:MAG: glucosamine-6-phosphate deaminase [Candidatus Acidiferrum sp.]
MIFRVFEEKQALSEAAATHAAAIIRGAIKNSGFARVVAATGTSQFEFLETLTNLPGIDWQKVELFQLDEYIGLPTTHPASFSKYIQERLVTKTGITSYHSLNGEGDPAETVRIASAAIRVAAVDVAFAGVGENGHLAFNDPPADFDTSDPYSVVNLDHACRQQQVGEGWFSGLAEVPKQAISMSIRQILKAKEIIAVVPEARKAHAVKACLEGPISPMAPASILRTHAGAAIYLDKQSAALLSPATLSAASPTSAEAASTWQSASHSQSTVRSNGGR